MNDNLSEFLQKVASESEGRTAMLDKIVSAADSSKVFGEPVTSGQYTVITACEVASGGGFGSGMGFGGPPTRPNAGSDVPSQGRAANALESVPEGGGGGGGGGGGSFGRPVAAIVIGPDGVEVKPVLDVTKVGLAAFTAFGAVVALSLKMFKARR